MSCFKFLVSAFTFLLLSGCITTNNEANNSLPRGTTSNQTLALETLSDAKQLKANSLIYGSLYSSDAYKVLAEHAKHFDARLNIACGSNYRIHAFGLVVLEPITMAKENDNPVSGRWLYKFKADRCNSSKRYNLMAIANKSGKTKFVSTLPGTTIATPRLQYDAIKIAVATVAVKHRSEPSENFQSNCMPNPIVFDTKFMGVKGISWEEKWTFLYCGKKLATVIKFTPDGVGGTHFSTQMTKQ